MSWCKVTSHETPKPSPRKLPKPARPILESTVPESVAIDLCFAGRISPAEIRCPHCGRCFRRTHAVHLPDWSNLYVGLRQVRPRQAFQSFHFCRFPQKWLYKNRAEFRFVTPHRLLPRACNAERAACEPPQREHEQLGHCQNHSQERAQKL